MLCYNLTRTSRLLGDTISLKHKAITAKIDVKNLLYRVLHLFDH